MNILDSKYKVKTNNTAEIKVKISGLKSVPISYGLVKLSTKDINYPKFSYEHNMFLKKNHKYEIIRKSNSRIFDDKAKISTADEDSLNTKKNFYW